MPVQEKDHLDRSNERLRIKLGSSLVIASIVALVTCLLIVTWHIGAATVTDAVALLGTVTTFLGGVIGVFFGISANSAVHAQAAQTASDVSATAGKAVDAATKAMDQVDTTNTALAKATQEMHSAKSAFQDTLQNFQAGAPETAAAFAFRTDLAAVDPGVGATSFPVAGDETEPLDRMALPAAHAVVLDELTSVTRLGGKASASAQQVFGSDLLRVAGAEADAHVSRDTDRPRVTEYLKLLGLPFADDRGTPTRYCAAGVTWAACRAYCDANSIAYGDVDRLAILRSVLADVRRSFKPSASCPDIMDDAKSRKIWMAKSGEPKPGYLVLYNWQKGEMPQHIGIVVAKGGDSLQTIEFNTSTTDAATGQSDGGVVARKTRGLDFVIGYVRTY